MFENWQYESQVYKNEISTRNVIPFGKLVCPVLFSIILESTVGCITDNLPTFFSATFCSDSVLCGQSTP